MNRIMRYGTGREMMTLREAMDRLFEDAYMHPSSLMGSDSGSPAVDMYQTDDEVIVKAALPGMKADDVEISIRGDVLTLSGEAKHEEESKEKTYHMREQRWESFERNIQLPTDVQSEQAEAGFEDGILTIHLPKAEKVRPKTITVKAK